MMKMIGLKVLFAGAIVALSTTLASATTTLSFYNITNEASTDAANQLSVAVTDNGSGSAVFKFAVASGSQMGAVITGIYFDDGTSIFNPPPVIGDASSTTGVSFSSGGSPSNLPSGGNASPPFVTTSDLYATSNNNACGVNCGINVGEWLDVLLSYGTGKSFSDLLAALNDGSFRVGLHVASLTCPTTGCPNTADGTASDSFVSLAPVPIPATGLLLIGAIGGLGLIRRRKKPA